MTTERCDEPEHFAAIGWQLINNLKPTDNPKPEENPMTHTTQPLDLEPIRQRTDSATPGPWKATDHYPHLVIQADEDQMVSTNLAGDPVADAEFIAAARTDVPALIAEVERLRATNETLLNHLGDAADKLLALGWDDVATQMENGTYRPAADPHRCRCGAMWGHRHADTCTHADAAEVTA